MRAAFFERVEESICAALLGPFRFRCAVCGHVHASERSRQWTPCVRKLAEKLRGFLPEVGRIVLDARGAILRTVLSSCGTAVETWLVSLEEIALAPAVAGLAVPEEAVKTHPQETVLGALLRFAERSGVVEKRERGSFVRALLGCSRQSVTPTAWMIEETVVGGERRVKAVRSLGGGTVRVYLALPVWLAERVAARLPHGGEGC